MRNLAWAFIARIVTIPAVTAWLIQRAKRTPYTHITSRDGSEVYMGRWWLFNPYPKDANGDPGPARWAWLPSIRIHHIMRADDADDPHDHPWNARTIVLRYWYAEEREPAPGGKLPRTFFRSRGYTGRLLFGEYHHIRTVPEGGVWTLFFTWKKQGTWGFLVDGKKVPWRKYLGLEQA